GAPVTVTGRVVMPLSVIWPALMGGGGGAWAVMVTVTGVLSRVPSLTMSCATYVPAWSTTNVGWTVVGAVRVAALPVGTTVKAQRKVSGSPSTSLDALPSSATVGPTKTVCGGPALATGGELVVEMVTVAGALSTVPSLTMNCTV